RINKAHKKKTVMHDSNPLQGSTILSSEGGPADEDQTVGREEVEEALKSLGTNYTKGGQGGKGTSKELSVAQLRAMVAASVRKGNALENVSENIDFLVAMEEICKIIEHVELQKARKKR
ncbi:unnamed protein product, partial [Amoebophrya sp. A25]